MNKFSSNKTHKKSPIKALPLRLAGQSIDEEIHRIQSEEIGAYVAVAVLFCAMAAFEWYKYLRDLPPQPILTSIGAIGIIIYCLIKVLRYRKAVRILKLGRDGERAVGEFLERLREHGYRIFHDIVGGDFNIDHLLIGETGIYTIETKTISKPVRGNHEIQFDGDIIKIGRYELDRNPVTQAKAQAKWIKELIMDLTGRRIKVQPVVLFPGWYCRQPKGSEVWVLNPKALNGFLEKTNTVLKKEEVYLLSTHLSRYVRNTPLKF
jgi:hypothetical protein